MDSLEESLDTFPRNLTVELILWNGFHGLRRLRFWFGRFGFDGLCRGLWAVLYLFLIWNGFLQDLFECRLCEEVIGRNKYAKTDTRDMANGSKGKDFIVECHRKLMIEVFMGFSLLIRNNGVLSEH